VSGGDTAGTTLHLAIGAFVFALGIAGLILRPNAVVAVAALELMLVAAAFSLVAGDRRYEQPDGALAALVVVAFGIAQLAIAVGLLRPLLRSDGATDLDDLAGRLG
jgi:NADH-quinone oxidoreductase subunit K